MRRKSIQGQQFQDKQKTYNYKPTKKLQKKPKYEIDRNKTKLELRKDSRKKQPAYKACALLTLFLTK